MKRNRFFLKNPLRNKTLLAFTVCAVYNEGISTTKGSKT